MARLVVSPVPPVALAPQQAALQAPDQSLVGFVDAWAPGVFSYYIDALVGALQALEPAQLAQLSITSWYRSPDHNRRVGGSRDSQHQIGLGVDFAGPSAAQAAIAQALRARGLVVADEGDHIHAQAWPAGVARSVGLLPALGL